METTVMSIAVTTQGESGIYSVLVSWIGESGVVRTNGAACHFSQLPSVLCELVHETTGSITLVSGGAFG